MWKILLEVTDVFVFEKIDLVFSPVSSQAWWNDVLSGRLQVTQMTVVCTAPLVACSL